METTKSSFASSFSEVNLKIIFKKIFKRKIFFIVSVFLCCLAAFLYLKTTVNVYEVSTTILIDPEGKNSLLSESKYIEGGVGLLEKEKNLFNEKSILKSFSLIQEAINELDFDVSFYNGTWYRKKEYYHNFPFEVTFKDSTAQMYGVFFKVEPLSDEKFKLIVETKKFDVLNPETGAIREIEKDFEFSNTYAFGEEINHKYFNFTLNKTKIDFDEFEDEDFWFKFHTVDGLTKTYMGRLQVDQTDLQGSILRLMTTGKVIEKEKLFLEKLTEKYIDSKIEERERIAKKKENFLIQQLASMSDSLSRAESRLEYFKKVANLSNIQQSSTYALEQLQNLESNKTQLESNIKYYKTILQYISDSTGIEKIIAPSVVGINDPLLNENLLELKRLNSEKIRNRFFKGRQSYDLEIMEQQIKNTTIVLQENLKNLIQATEISLADKSQQLSSLESTINQLPTNERMLLNLERKTSRFENFYNYLSQELAKTGIAKAESILDTKVLDAPRMKGSGAVAPQKKMIMALSFMMGLFIPFLWIMFFDPYDGEITNAEQIEAFSSVPIIANIAHKSSRTPKFDTSSDNWQVDETFRDLIANLQVSIVDTTAKVIGVTSTVPKEGKTFCAIELAKSLAAQGKKTLLLETDIRNPNIIRDIKEPQDNKLQLKDVKKNSLPPTNGLTTTSNKSNEKDNPGSGPVFEFELAKNEKTGLIHYLKNEVTLNNFRDIIHQYDHTPNLKYIPSQQVGDDNPHLLLSDPKLGQLIHKLKENFDFIVIDSAPVGVVSDYLLLSRFIDISIFVIRKNVSKLSYLKGIDKIIKKGKLRNPFLLFNDVSGKSFKYGYGKDYQYGGKPAKKYSYRKS